MASGNTVAAQASDLLTRIENGGTVSIATEGTYVPFTYHDETGKLTGYDVEVARAVADRLGFKIEFRETSWDSMLAGLKAGRYDLVANQVSLTTPERRATFDKSENYNYSGPMVLTHRDGPVFQDIKEIKGLKAAQTLSSNYGELARDNEAVIVPVDGMAQALTLLNQKRVDLTINNSLALLDYLNTHPNASLQIAWRSSEKNGAGFVANKGQEDALAKISEAVRSLREDGTLKKLSIQFFGEDVSVE
ncbi:amino acid ABC transporter substrate-binding protein [Basilea psittacipulmonis]|uniref:Amino acid ABC transporter substrate-binding protein n=1 Tax=Basilea psittacipulmonis DSM 24701 TaxID=1072685 RepID=A0A077DBH6_9BURK|nr:amino acid ABC transporter substrate-binding protein [Basilea psittacipulmonis]AIL32195.1 amino acid ABC transporter substrate-binding protein [Basilea psittacipulmonis DSM 24701]